jgi:hypothetical protein
MKLFAILQAGGLKKALALAGIGGAFGVAFKGNNPQEDHDSSEQQPDSKDSVRLNFVTNQANRKVRSDFLI